MKLSYSFSNAVAASWLSLLALMIIDAVTATDAIVPPPRPPPSLSASSGGDVDSHFKTWNGTKSYDFHGMCDLVLLSNPGFANEFGMDIHIRTKFNNKDQQWSYIESAVLRLGPTTLEVSANGNYWIDGFIGSSKQLRNGDVFKMYDFPVVYHEIINNHQQPPQRRRQRRRFLVDLLGRNGGDAIVLETYDDEGYVRVTVHARDSHSEDFVGAVGMMGSYPNGTMMARDGKTILEDANEFGQEWQVQSVAPNNDLELFHTVEGTVQYPMECVLPDDLAEVGSATSGSEAAEQKTRQLRSGEALQ